MADIVKTVGDGHALPDYATLTLWNAAEGGNDPGVGFTSIAECSGFCGAGANINGAFVRGAIIRGDVTWDGTNGASLAGTERLTITTGSGIDVTDLRIFTNNQFISAMNYNADFIEMDRVIFDNTTTGLNALDINGTFNNGHIRNFVARGGADAIMSGFNQGTKLTNGLVYGAADKGIEGSTSTPMVLTNILAFNNGGQDIDSAGGFTLIDCATEDSTGTYTGYTSAELVGFAGGDLRTKSTSDLANLGSPFIGAFLESGGGGGISGDVELSVEEVKFAASGSATLPQPNGAIDFAINEIEFTCSASVTLPNPSGEIGFDLSQIEFNSTGGATLPQPVGEIDFGLLSIDFTGSGSATIPFPVGAASFDIALIEFNATGSPTQPNPSGGVELDISSIEFVGSGSVSLPFPVGGASFEVAQIEFIGTGQATLPQPSGNSDFSVDEVGFYATGSATQPDSVGDIAFDIASIEFSAIGSVTGVTLPFGDVILPAYTSNVIILNTPPNLIKL